MKITKVQREKLLALNQRVGFDTKAGREVTRWLKCLRARHDHGPVQLRPEYIEPVGCIVVQHWTMDQARVLFLMLRSALGERLTPAYKRGFEQLLGFVSRSFSISAVDLLANLAPHPGVPRKTVSVFIGPKQVDLGVHGPPLLGDLLVTLRDVCEKLEVEPGPAVRTAFASILRAQLDLGKTTAGGSCDQERSR